MTCQRISNGFICSAPVYKLDDFVFEVHSYCGPCPLRKDTLEPWKRFPSEKHRFWKTWDKFSKLSKKEKEKYLI